ncbi:MAG: OFA family MFS transporter [Clostridiaceae bacterium]
MKEIKSDGTMNLKQRWLYVVVGIIIMMCLGTVYSWSVFRMPVQQLYNIGTTESGLPYMTSLAFYSFFMFLAGRYLDKYSPRTIIFVGSALVTLGWILSAFAPNIYVLTITYGCIIGAGVGIAYGAPMSVAAKWFPEKKGLVVGIVLVGFGLSPLVTAPLVRSLLGVYGVIQTFKILGIVFGIIIPVLACALKYPEDNKDSKLVSDTSNDINEINTKEMVKSKGFKGLYINFIIGTMIGLTIIGVTGNVGNELIKLSPTTVALLMSVFAIFNGLGRPTFGWLTDKISSQKAMLLSYGLMFFSALLMIVAREGNIGLFVIAFSIFWFNLGGWLAIAPTSTMAMYGTKYYSQNYGVVFTAYGIGAITGVLTSGLLVDIFKNYHAIFYFIICLCILGILFSQTMMKDK